MKMIKVITAAYIAVAVACFVSILHCENSAFYVYKNRTYKANHYIPSGWMGDVSDLKMNNGWKDDALKEKDGTCIQWKYTAARSGASGWAGVYWQNPANNWGDRRGGFDLKGYKKCSFYAKGEKGGEMIDKFMFGGITGQTKEGDSDLGDTGQIELTKEWKEYEIDLNGLDMSYIIGGFGFAINADSNPDGATFYIDEVKYQ